MYGQKVLIGDKYIDSFYILSVFIKIGENKLIFYYKTFIEIEFVWKIGNNFMFGNFKIK